MTKIMKPFRLTLDNGEIMTFAPGDHDFTTLPGREADTTKDYSEHFFVRAHSDNPVDGRPVPGSAQHVAAMRALAEKKTTELLEAQQALADAEAAAVEQGNRMAQPFGKSLQVADTTGIIGTQLGPNNEGALRQVSPGQKGAGDMHSASGNTLNGPQKRVDDEATPDGLEDIDADAALAEQEARAASQSSGRVKLAAPIEPTA
jgi:hypothetical protein